MDANHDAAELFVIYDRGGTFELQEMFVTNVVAKSETVAVVLSLEEARSLMPLGLKRVSHVPRAEAHIAEIWR